ncbi:hypothetical protein V6N11_013775 [Hibiscus sabdariffa]|uniref:Uncharacterized protein n=2 Tax=Hibiscus sabdariffa TaxID=183260 RepID=A0ABR2PDG2_9ROSI
MFYNGVNAPTRMMLDASANGTLLDKSAEEATEILDRLANNDYQLPSTRRGMARRNATTYELEPTDSISAQLAALTNMVKNLQRPSSSQELKEQQSILQHIQPRMEATSKLFVEQSKKSQQYNSPECRSIRISTEYVTATESIATTTAVIH